MKAFGLVHAFLALMVLDVYKNIVADEILKDQFDHIKECQQFLMSYADGPNEKLLQSLNNEETFKLQNALEKNIEELNIHEINILKQLCSYRNHHRIRRNIQSISSQSNSVQSNSVQSNSVQSSYVQSNATNTHSHSSDEHMYSTKTSLFTSMFSSDQLPTFTPAASSSSQSSLETRVANTPISTCSTLISSSQQQTIKASNTVLIKSSKQSEMMSSSIDVSKSMNTTSPSLPTTLSTSYSSYRSMSRSLNGTADIKPSTDLLSSSFMPDQSDMFSSFVSSNYMTSYKSTIQITAGSVPSSVIVSSFFSSLSPRMSSVQNTSVVERSAMSSSVIVSSFLSSVYPSMSSVQNTSVVKRSAVSSSVLVSSFLSSLSPSMSSMRNASVAEQSTMSSSVLVSSFLSSVYSSMSSVHNTSVVKRSAVMSSVLVSSLLSVVSPSMSSVQNTSVVKRSAMSSPVLVSSFLSSVYPSMSYVHNTSVMERSVMSSSVLVSSFLSSVSPSMTSVQNTSVVERSAMSTSVITTSFMPSVSPIMSIISSKIISAQNITSVVERSATISSVMSSSFQIQSKMSSIEGLFTELSSYITTSTKRLDSSLSTSRFTTETRRMSELPSQSSSMVTKLTSASTSSPALSKSTSSSSRNSFKINDVSTVTKIIEKQSTLLPSSISDKLPSKSTTETIYKTMQPSFTVTYKSSSNEMLSQTPLSSSSSSITVIPPKETEHQGKATLEANCENYLNNETAIVILENAFSFFITRTIKGAKVVFPDESIECGSVIITFQISSLSTQNEIETILQNSLEDGNANIDLPDTTLKVIDFKVVEVTSVSIVVTPSTSTVAVISSSVAITDPTPPAVPAKGKKDLTTLYITTFTVIGVLLLIIIVAIIIGCRKKETTGSFKVTDSYSNYELGTFQRISKANSAINMYGAEATLHDAAEDNNKESKSENGSIKSKKKENMYEFGNNLPAWDLPPMYVDNSSKERKESSSTTKSSNEDLMSYENKGLNLDEF